MSARGRTLNFDAKFGNNTLKGVRDIVSRLGTAPYAVRPGGNVLGRVRTVAGRLSGLLGNNQALVRALSSGLGIALFLVEVHDIPATARQVAGEEMRAIEIGVNRENDIIDDATAGTYRAANRGLEAPLTTPDPGTDPDPFGDDS